MKKCSVCDQRKATSEFFFRNKRTGRLHSQCKGCYAGLTSTYSWEHILEEVAKCQILCANCHKIKTAEERNWYK